MRAELKELHQSVAATMVHVTHDQVEALTLADRLAVLDRGVVQQVGAPDDVYRNPVNRFVARFVGTPAMNLLSARVDPEGLDLAGMRAPPPPPEARGRSLEVGIRPERVRIDAAGVRALVRLVEPAGSEVFVHLELDDQQVVARVAAEARPETGDTVGVVFPREDLHLFDAESGERLRWSP
jgi:ABC-type sugar transport system ATPase subunit